MGLWSLSKKVENAENQITSHKQKYILQIMELFTISDVAKILLKKITWLQTASVSSLGGLVSGRSGILRFYFLLLFILYLCNSYSVQKCK